MRMFKKIFAAISAVTIVSTGSLCASAYPDLLHLSYEAGSDEYVECCQDMTKVPYEEKLGVLLNAGINQKWYSVYYAPGRDDETFSDDKISDIKYGNANEYMIEIDDPNNTTEKDQRRFLGIKVYFNNLFDMDGKGGVLSNSIENINSFLKENGYDAKVELNSLNEGWIDRLYITYGEDVNTKEMVDILYSLYQEFDLEPFTYGTYGSIVIAGASLSSDNKITDIETIVSLLKEHFKGTAIENNIYIRSDIVCITMYDMWDKNGAKDFENADELTKYMEEQEKPIKDFLIEANIDPDLVGFAWAVSSVGASNEVAGDANEDNIINVSDCVFIAKNIAKGKGAELPDSADYNKDGRKNVLDASTLAKDIAENKLN